MPYIILFSSPVFALYVGGATGPNINEGGIGMQGLMYLVFFTSLIAFIVFWRKKTNARKVAGENYNEDPNYLKISKTKKIIGAVCVISLILGLFTGENTPSSKSNSTKQSVQTSEKKDKSPEELAAEKEAKEKEAAEAAAKQAQKAEEDKLQEIQTGWDTANQMDDEHKNIQKAFTLIKKYPDYIPNQSGEPLNAQQAMQKPWDFYGKVVTLSGIIYGIEHYPPDNNVTKFVGKECFNAMVRTNDDVYVSVDIVGSGDGIQNNSQVTLKGYVTGLTELHNTKYGGKSKGVNFVGRACERISVN